MFRASINVNEHSDPKITMESFRKECAQSNVSDPDALYGLVSAQVKDLSERGSQLAAVGSSFKITRTLDGDDYEITLKASFGSKPTIGERVKSLFGL